MRERALAVDGAAELARPEDERVVEQAAAAEVLDQRGLRLIDRLALQPDLLGQVVVRVPAAHVELDEAHAALGEAPGEEAVRRERAGLANVGAVEREGLLALSGEVDELGHRHLHAVRHLVLRDARLDLGIERARELASVELGDDVEQPAPIVARDAVGVLQEEDRVGPGPQPAALVLAREEAAAPEARRQRLHVAEPLRDQHDERREVRVQRCRGRS